MILLARASSIFLISAYPCTYLGLQSVDLYTFLYNCPGVQTTRIPAPSDDLDREIPRATSEFPKYFRGVTLL